MDRPVGHAVKLIAACLQQRNSAVSGNCDRIAHPVVRISTAHNVERFRRHTFAQGFEHRVAASHSVNTLFALEATRVLLALLAALPFELLLVRLVVNAVFGLRRGALALQPTPPVTARALARALCLCHVQSLTW